MKVSIPGLLLLYCAIAISFFSCKKSKPADNTQPPPGDTTIVITPPNDPAIAPTIGFFGNNWSPKTFTTPSFIAANKPTAAANATVTVDMSNVLTKVSKYLFGNNSNLWMGQIVDQPNLMGYLKDLSPDINRAPAGSVSDVYFFNS